MGNFKWQVGDCGCECVKYCDKDKNKCCYVSICEKRDVNDVVDSWKQRYPRTSLTVSYPAFFLKWNCIEINPVGNTGNYKPKEYLYCTDIDKVFQVTLTDPPEFYGDKSIVDEYVDANENLPVAVYPCETPWTNAIALDRHNDYGGKQWIMRVGRVAYEESNSVCDFALVVPGHERVILTGGSSVNTYMGDYAYNVFNIEKTWYFAQDVRVYDVVWLTDSSAPAYESNLSNAVVFYATPIEKSDDIFIGFTEYNGGTSGNAIGVDNKVWFTTSSGNVLKASFKLKEYGKTYYFKRDFINANGTVKTIYWKTTAVLQSVNSSSINSLTGETQVYLQDNLTSLEYSFSDDGKQIKPSIEKIEGSIKVLYNFNGILIEKIPYVPPTFSSGMIDESEYNENATADNSVYVQASSEGTFFQDGVVVGPELGNSAWITIPKHNAELSNYAADLIEFEIADIKTISVCYAFRYFAFARFLSKESKPCE